MIWPSRDKQIEVYTAAFFSSMVGFFPVGFFLAAGFLVLKSSLAQRLKRLPAMQETRVQSLGRKDPLEKEMATYSSILAWRIPWMEEPGRLQSTGLQRVGHDWAISLHSLGPCSFFTHQSLLHLLNANSLLSCVSQYRLLASNTLLIWFGS